MVWKHDKVAGDDGKPRCGWVSQDPLYRKYHDSEWGRPLRDDRALFELLTLEGCQAGLSWITVLRKREHYRKVYDGFDPKSLNDVPARSAESDAMAKALQTAGFKFVGSTICYAFMQASGMVDDHIVGCHRHKA